MTNTDKLKDQTAQISAACHQKCKAVRELALTGATFEAIKELWSEDEDEFTARDRSICHQLDSLEETLISKARALVKAADKHKRLIDQRDARLANDGD